MARSFRGSEEQTIDAKGRVSVPASFRRVIEAGDPDWTSGLRATLVIVFGTEKQNHLKCYTLEGIEQVERRIKKMKLGSDERKAMEEIYHGYVQEVPVLEDGRIVLPQKLREKLGLKSKALFMAASDKFLIWEPDTYQATRGKSVDAWIEAQGPNFDPESVLPELDDELDE